MAPLGNAFLAKCNFQVGAIFFWRKDMTQNQLHDNATLIQGWVAEATSKAITSLFLLNGAGVILLVQSFKTFKGYPDFFISLLCFGLGLISVLKATFLLKRNLELLFDATQKAVGDVDRFKASMEKISKNYYHPYRTFLFISLNLFILGCLLVLVAYMFRIF